METTSIERHPTLYPAGPADRIPLGEGRRVQVGGEAVAVFRTRAGEIFAVQADCPHLGGPLADGLLGGGRVACPLHGYTFDLATGEAVRNPCSALRTYRVRVSESGEVLIAAAETFPSGQSVADRNGPVRDLPRQGHADARPASLPDAGSRRNGDDGPAIGPDERMGS